MRLFPVPECVNTENCASNKLFAFLTGIENPNHWPVLVRFVEVIPFSESQEVTAVYVSAVGDVKCSAYRT